MHGLAFEVYSFLNLNLKESSSHVATAHWEITSILIVQIYLKVVASSYTERYTTFQMINP
jgi:hypothetical protein